MQTNETKPSESKKFLVSSSYLAEAIKYFDFIKVKNPTLPCLAFYKMTISHEQLTIAASNLEIFIETTVNIDSTCDFEFLVPNKLKQIISLIPSQPVIFEYFESEEKLVIKCDGETFTLNIWQASNFPKKYNDDKELIAVIPSEAIKPLQSELYQHRLYRGTDDLRPNLTGTYFEFSPEGLKITSTNANYLRTAAIDTISGNGNIILSGEVLNLLSKISTQTLIINKIGYAIEIKTDTLTITAKFIDEKYPDYEKVIPVERPIKYTVNLAALRTLLNKARLMMNKTTHQGKFTFKDNLLTISTFDYDTNSEYQGTIKSNKISGYDIEIGFNINFLKTVINSFSKLDELSIEMSTPNRAAIISNGGVTVLLMPVMLNDLN